MGVRGVRVQTQQIVVALGMPAARVHARSSRGPGSQRGGTVLTAPRVHSAAIAAKDAVDRRPHQRGVLVGAADLGCQPGLVDHLGQRRGPPQLVHDHRKPGARRPPRRPVTIWPEAASTPQRSATAGGTDSAVKKESWLTSPTVSQVADPRLQAVAGLKRVA